jgi:hypothetical protein
MDRRAAPATRAWDSVIRCIPPLRGANRGVDADALTARVKSAVLQRARAGAVRKDSTCVASPTGVVPEWTRPVPGEVPAGSGSGRQRNVAESLTLAGFTALRGPLRL